MSTVMTTRTSVPPPSSSSGVVVSAAIAPWRCCTARVFSGISPADDAQVIFQAPAKSITTNMLCDSLVLRQRPELYAFSDRSIRHDGAIDHSTKESNYARPCIREPQLPFEYPVYRSIEHLLDSLQQAHDRCMLPGTNSWWHSLVKTLTVWCRWLWIN